MRWFTIGLGVACGLCLALLLAAIILILKNSMTYSRFAATLPTDVQARRRLLKQRFITPVYTALGSAAAAVALAVAAYITSRL